MQKYRILIVEDEEIPLQRLCSFLQTYPKIIDVERITVARSFSEAQEIILNRNEFDLSILDQKLGKGKTCFDLITRKNRDLFGIIALKSQDTNSQKYFEKISPAGGYLVLRKPYNKEDVGNLMNDLVARRPLRENLTLALNDSNGTISIYQKDIIYIEVDNERKNYCLIHYLRNGSPEKYSKKCTLTYLEEELDKKIFVRIHSSYLVNVLPENISKVQPGTVFLTHSNCIGKNDLPVSENYASELNRRLGKKL